MAKRTPRTAKTNFRKIVNDRLTALQWTPQLLAREAAVSPTTLYDFLRDPKDYEEYKDARTRKGSINSEALARIFDALELTVAG